MKRCRLLQRFGISLLCLLIHQCKCFSGLGVTPPSRRETFHNPTTKSVSAKTMSSSAASEVDIQKEPIVLSSGVTMEVLWSVPNNAARKEKDAKQLPPLIFLHGSFHGAWCWAEHFLPYFVSLGYPVAALNWRGTGGTFAGEGIKKVKMEEHVQDFKSFLKEFVATRLPTEQKPILISHSFGGLTIMKYLEEYGSEEIGGAVIMCSVPPSGNGRMTMRFLRRSLRASWKITKGLAMKKVIDDPNLCRELFFGGLEDDHEVSNEDITRYQGYFDRDSEATIDLMDLAKKLPSAKIDDNGRALFLASSSSSSPPFLVMGATEDFIVDGEGVDETARYFGLDSAVMVDSPHDLMLGRKWRNAAEEIHRWVQDVALATT